MAVNAQEITNLNSRADLDFFSAYDDIYRDDFLNDDPYFRLNILSKFYDVQYLANLDGKSIFLSINIQSLHSKHESLVQEIIGIEQKM